MRWYFGSAPTYRSVYSFRRSGDFFGRASLTGDGAVRLVRLPSSAWSPRYSPTRRRVHVGAGSSRRLYRGVGTSAERVSTGRLLMERGEAWRVLRDRRETPVSFLVETPVGLQVMRGSPSPPSACRLGGLAFHRVGQLLGELRLASSVACVETLPSCGRPPSARAAIRSRWR